jgi:hypothetical protein
MRMPLHEGIGTIWGPEFCTGPVDGFRRFGGRGVAALRGEAQSRRSEEFGLADRGHGDGAAENQCLEAAPERVGGGPARDADFIDGEASLVQDFHDVPQGEGH